jgi:hypothetical protein
MAKTTKIKCNCPSCGIERFVRGDRSHRVCRKCSYKKISESRKGWIPSEETKQKMSEGAKKRTWTEEEKEKRKQGLIKAHTGNKYSLGKRKENSKYSENYRDRRIFRAALQKLIFERDNYSCKHCNKKGGYLQVNHIKEWSKFPELRFDIDNCETLCMDCHYKHTFNKEKPSHIKNWGHNLSKKLEKNEHL